MFPAGLQAPGMYQRQILIREVVDVVHNDILLDPEGDIMLDEYGDAILGKSVVQDINVHLRWFLGEWPFDTSLGTDWYGEAFVKNPDTDRIARMVRKVIEGIDGIRLVESVEVAMDAAGRKAKIAWKAKMDTDILESEVELWQNTALHQLASF